MNAEHHVPSMRGAKWARTALLASLAAILSACISPAERREPAKDNWHQYAMKFVCGKPAPSQEILNHGRYFTAVNVHNPDLKRPVDFWFKVAVAEPVNLEDPSTQAGAISGFKNVILKPDGATEIDCPTIQKLAEPAPFRKGFVVVLSREELDIVAVYTAGREPAAVDEVDALHMERVAPRSVGDPQTYFGEKLGDSCRGEGCCCNSPKTADQTGPRWGPCSPNTNTTCVGFEPWAPIPGIDRPSVCRQDGSNAPPFIHSSQPRYCREDLR